MGNEDQLNEIVIQNTTKITNGSNKILTPLGKYPQSDEQPHLTRIDCPT
jgi:hypothetical protein